MPTKRISINVTKPEDVEELVQLTIELQRINNKVLNYTDILRILVKYGRQYPHSVLNHA